VPVLEGVFVTTGTAQLAWSPAGALVYLGGTGTAAEREFVRVGRDGAPVPIDTAWHGAYNSFALAADGRRLAVGTGLTSGALGIWVKQLDRGPFTRLTFGGQDRRPAWSPDGRIVAFVRDSGNHSAVFARPADGSGADRMLARLDRAIQEVTWSPDGRWVVVRTDTGGAGVGDLVGVRTSGDTTPVPLAASEFTELHPAISPDGRWLAYTSNESGANEVYVRPFPATSGGRWQVSTVGGNQPQWSRDGRELFFASADGSLVAAQVRTAQAFEVTELRTLFATGGFTGDAFHQSFEVLPDGRGFVFLRERRSGQASSAPAIVYAENWFADLRARVGR
jgi:dipeptidyl aminopeptidase/acylaminoacyl peptidase